jgi:hypothetical protein
VTGEKTTVRSEKEHETPVSENTTPVIKGHFLLIIVTKKVKTERWMW